MTSSSQRSAPPFTGASQESLDSVSVDYGEPEPFPDQPKNQLDCMYAGGEEGCGQVGLKRSQLMLVETPDTDDASWAGKIWGGLSAVLGIAPRPLQEGGPQTPGGTGEDPEGSPHQERDHDALELCDETDPPWHRRCRLELIPPIADQTFRCDPRGQTLAWIAFERVDDRLCRCSTHGHAALLASELFFETSCILPNLA